MSRAVVISISNHKGGTGKTTTTLNVACALRDAGNKVAIIDLDPQANLSYSIGQSKPPFGIVELLQQNCTVEQALLECSGLQLIPMRIQFQLDDAETQPQFSQHIFNTLLSELQVDYILIDCPPATGQLTKLALTASDFVLVPMLLEVLSIQGLDQILQFIKLIQLSKNPELQILGVLAVCVNDSRKLTSEVLEYISNKYDVHVFNNRVHNNVKAAEAPSFAKSVIDYAPHSTSARDYRAVTNELLKIIQIQTV